MRCSSTCADAAREGLRRMTSSHVEIPPRRAGAELSLRLHCAAWAEYSDLQHQTDRRSSRLHGGFFFEGSALRAHFSRENTIGSNSFGASQPPCLMILLPPSLKSNRWKPVAPWLSSLVSR